MGGTPYDSRVPSKIHFEQYLALQGGDEGAARPLLSQGPPHADVISDAPRPRPRRKRRKRRKRRQQQEARESAAAAAAAAASAAAAAAAAAAADDDLPKRARWTIVVTAGLLLVMSMLLVGITLRMAPLIDEMVRKENEEHMNRINRANMAGVNGSVDVPEAGPT